MVKFDDYTSDEVSDRVAIYEEMVTKLSKDILQDLHFKTIDRVKTYTYIIAKLLKTLEVMSPDLFMETLLNYKNLNPLFLTILEKNPGMQ